MLRRLAMFASAAALTVAAMTPIAHAGVRELPSVALSPDAECWMGEAYGEQHILCEEDGVRYVCRVARTECWRYISPGPYRRGFLNPTVRSSDAGAPTALRARN